jgi:hypothetical protein
MVGLMPPDNAISGEGSMICVECGKQIRDNMYFCPECGAEQRSASPSPAPPKVEPIAPAAPERWKGDPVRFSIKGKPEDIIVSNRRLFTTSDKWEWEIQLRLIDRLEPKRGIIRALLYVYSYSLGTRAGGPDYHPIYMRNYDDASILTDEINKAIARL